MHHHLRDLPPVQGLLEQDTLQEGIERFGRAEVTKVLRMILSELREKIMEDDLRQFPDFKSMDFARSVMDCLQARRGPGLRRLVNSTGIIIHTNLGRGRLAPEAIAAVQEAGRYPVNLEYDLKSGKRGSRQSSVEGLICALTGAEAALVVNNCAAAVLLSLLGCAAGRQVVASRGELVEIGGSYRLPDVITQSGALLREVGTTNRTRLSDYKEAICEDTAVLLKSHTSNFRITGFTASPSRQSLSELARERGLLLFEDLGSGALVDLSKHGLAEEPVVADVLASGVDIAMFSGDKLLGGPQAGVLAGKAAVIEKLKANPVARAMRVDKLSLAALEATLKLYLPPHDPLQAVPVLRMLSEPIEAVRRRAEKLCVMLERCGDTLTAKTVSSAAQVGGGTLPGQDIESFAVALSLSGQGPDALAAKLRAGEVPIIGRIVKDRLLLDMRTVEEAELPLVAEALAAITAQ